MAIVLKRNVRPVGTLARYRRASEGTLLRPSYVKKTPPCAAACPNGNDMRGCLTTIAQSESAGRSYEQSLEKAWYIITNTNPFPSVCGQVCPHLCESDCNRNERDAAVYISAVERVIGDYGIAQNLRLKKITEESYPEKVAIIGSGPAGLSCAYQLARRGYPVTVFEAFDKAGGMLRYGIPDYRLPKETLDAEIGAIQELGVDIQYNTRVGEDIPLSELQKQYRAVYVAVGAHLGAKLGIPGEDMPNVLSGAEFLHRVNSGETIDVGRKVLVIGGGNSAIDAARVARRLGADVTIQYRRTRKEMPAIEHEVVGAEEEGIQFDFLSAPVKILADGKKATGATFIRMKLGEPDASGRARPIPVPGSEYDVSANTIIAAISQQPDFKGLEPLKNEQGWITVDDKCQTPLSGVFAGGDVTNQLGLVTEAIALGRKAAEYIDASLRDIQLPKPEPVRVTKAANMRLEFYKTMPRNEVPTSAASERVNNFNTITTPLVHSQVTDEASRCMSCGLCFGCDVCFTYCQDNAIKRSPEGADLKYFFNPEYCTGCKKCSEECPCGFIDMA